MTQTPSPVLFDYPNSKMNALLMMRFQETPQNNEITDAITAGLTQYGVNALRADDKSYASSLWSNVKAYMDACELGIAVFERIDDDDFNPNVSLELGYMTALNRRILILKEKRLRTLPSDIIGQLYTSFDSYDITNTVQSALGEWLKNIGIAKSPAEKIVLFVSVGGTCRCAMAKVATQRALEGRYLPFRLRVESIAHTFGSANEASHGARRAVYESYGEEYLADHRVMRSSKGLIADADLILVMEDSLREGLPKERVFAFNEFFGLSGPVKNPWPDDEDDAAHLRYGECMKHIRSVIETSIDRLVAYLGQSNM